jgi:DNA (cytosine-5)-methyltransferase 1
VINIDNFIEIHKDHIRVREATKQGYAIGVDGDSINFEQPNSKTRRGRIGHQIAQTLTCSCNQGVIIDKDNQNGDGLVKKFTNNLIRYTFEMDTIRLFDSFAGIGALHQNLTELGVPTKIIGLSETDVDAIISYAGVHVKGFKDIEFEYPSEDEMRKLLIDRNIGWDFIKQKSCIPKLKKDKLYECYKATMLLNNLGDISKLDYENLPHFDLFNFSFPCTDISNAGQQKGLKNSDGTPTRSGLVKYGIEVIKAKKPKYIMIENVKALIQKKFIDDFYDIVNEIEYYGYKCYYPKKDNGQPTCLNAKNYGIAQNRERIFVICVKDDIDDGLFSFPQGFDSGLRLKDFLEDEVDEKYYLSQEIQDKFKLTINSKEDKTISGAIRGRYNEDKKVEQQLELRDDKIINTLTTIQKDNVVIESQVLRSVRTEYGKEIRKQYESGEIQESRHNMTKLEPRNDGICNTLSTVQKDNLLLESRVDIIGKINSSQDGVVVNPDGISPTHTAGHGNCPKIFKEDIEFKDFRIRKLTPRECWRLMGFRDVYFDRAKELGVSDSALYKQAGNSIVVNCLYYIFKELFKKYIVK